MDGVRFVRFQDVVDQLDHVDDPDVLEKAKANQALRHALEMSRPENWRGSGLTPDQILPIAEGGIPVAWIPPRDVVKALVAAAPPDRMRVLLENQDAVIAHCHVLLDECDDPWVADERTLIRRAVAAFEAGFPEAAMALAVAVGEPLALWASVPRVQMFDSEQEKKLWEDKRKKQKYSLARLELAAVDPDRKLRRLEVLRLALIGPIPKFFTPFHAEPGEAIPETTSRHATVHRPTVKHLTTGNALVALMLCVSILREQQHWSEEVRQQESFAVPE